LTTGFAGYLSDRLSKRSIIVVCKIAEIVVMAAGGLGFAYYTRNESLALLYVVLFFMGAQSGFFGPSKYGILPEMLRAEDLPRANGFMLMTTFLSIIFGTAVAGFLLESFVDQLWVASVVCVAIAVVGTIASLFVRKLPPANPDLQFEWDALAVPHAMRELIVGDKPLLGALLVSSVFWMLAGMVPPAVNALGKTALKIGDTNTSILTAMIGVGIMVGCVLGGFISKGKVEFRLLRIGTYGMIACLALLAIPGTGNVAELMNDAGELTRLPGINESSQWLGYWGSLPTLLVLGAFTGMFAVPLQVFLQLRPPKGKKGRMIAVMNQANWVGIVISSGLYWGVTQLIEWQQWPRSVMFLFIASILVPVALFYHPKSKQP